MFNIRTYLLTIDEQLDFDPVRFTDGLKAVGFKFDSDRCPVKITKPWDRVENVDGSVLWRQWDEES